MRTTLLFLVLSLSFSGSVFAQETAKPRLRAASGAETIDVDGILSESAWDAAEETDAFAQTDPREGAPPTLRTVVRVLASPDALVIGIVCYDSDPDGIVSFSVRRDAGLNSEDHVQLILGPFADGRSGYVFAVNPSGARFDGLINPGPEGANSEWDGIWEAATTTNGNGWSVEIRIPIQTLSFKPGLREWHFNVQRSVERLLETARWASASRQYQITQTATAGLLTNLPEFSLGMGLTIRPALVTGGGIPSTAADIEGEMEPSLDLTQRIGSNVLASFTANTDFAETEVDTRRTNLTRFPLFFPEKRSFFLEGADIFQFGPLPNQDVIPYFSRSIGLVNGLEVPITAGAKVIGRVRNTNFGGLVVRTGRRDGSTDTPKTVAIARVKRNLWGESHVGAIATVGDPLGRTGSWLGGVDFTYATSRFLRDKNLIMAVWGLATGRDDLGTDRTAYALKIDYPNEQWDTFFWYKHAGRNFNPSLGFTPRRATSIITYSITNRTRLTGGPIQEMTAQFRPHVATDLSGRWESYTVGLNMLNWRLRSGDRLMFSATPTGERLTAPFEVSDDVEIPVASYEWWRYQVGASTAQKRRLYGSVNYNFGSFYGGDLKQVDVSATWNPAPLYTVEISGNRNVGRLPGGTFTQTLIGARLRINISSDLSVASYAQYDTVSGSIGVNTRLRWTFLPVADLFVVYNHNTKQSPLDRWELESNQLLVKLQYAWRL